MAAARAAARLLPGDPVRVARVAVAAYFFVLGAGFGVWVARIPAVKQRLELSDGMLGVALFAPPLGVVLALFVVGRLVDAHGSARVTRLAGISLVALLVPPGLAANLPTLIGALFVLGAVSAALDVAMNAHAVEVERARRRPLMASFHAVFSLGSLVGTGLGGLSARAGLSPAAAFAVTALALAAVAVAAGRGLLPASRTEPIPGPDPAPGPTPDRAAPAGETPPVRTAPSAAPVPPGHAARLPMADDPAAAPPGSRATLAALGVIAFCGLLGEGAAGDWSAVYLHEDLGTSPAYATLGFAAFAVTMTVGRLLGDRLAARFGPVRLVRGCALLAAAGLATGLLSGVPAAAVAGFGLLGAGLSCIVPQAFSAAGNIDPGRAGRNIARVAGIGYLGLLGGPVLIGALATWLDLPRALWLPVVLALVMAGFAGAMRRAAGGWRRSGGEPRVR